MKLISCGLSLFVSIAPTTVQSQELSQDNRNIAIAVTGQSGHLLDWSQTDRRIGRIMIDNPESFTKNIVFTTDGCSPKECHNASLLLVSSRPGAPIGYGGTMRVITYDRKQRLYPYTVTIKILKNSQAENETKFTLNNRQPAKP